MRSVSAQTSAVLAQVTRAEHLRVSIKDGGGTFRDLSSYPGFNAVDGLTIAEDIDGQHRTLDLSLKREVFNYSIARLMADAAANTGFVVGGTYSPLIELRREVKVEIAVCPMDISSPASGDYLEVFRGYVDRIDDGAGAYVKVECRDLGAVLQDTFIEKEHVYGLVASKAVRLWAPSTVYLANEYVVPSNARLNGHYYKCTAGGTTGATEPTTWNTGGGSTTSSGSAVFTEQGSTSTTGRSAEEIIQTILDTNVTSAPTLYTPASPSWVIRPYLQSRKPVLEAIRDIAATIGWDVRYSWRAGTSAFELTFATPDRAKTTPDATFTPAQYEDITSLSRDLESVRNAIRVVYSDSAALDPDGNPKRKYVEDSDSSSITTYGRRFMEIAEDASSQIDTLTEASLLAANALADLKEPKVTQEITTYLYPAVELGDLYRFNANLIHYTAAQDLAVVSFRHEMNADGSGGYSCRTQLSCRGKPAVANRRWLEASAGDIRYGPGGGIHRLQDFGTLAAPTLTVTSVVGGARITKTQTSTKGGVSDEFEVHVSTSSGFTPDSTTLVARSTSSVTEIGNLIPGTTYYYKIIQRGYNAGQLVRSEPSAEGSFVAGRASPGHLVTTYNYGSPMNGDFEAYTAGPSTWPDHWGPYSTSAFTDFEKYTSDTNSGSASFRFKPNTCTDQGVISDQFAVTDGGEYRLSFWCKVRAGALTSVLSLTVQFYQADGTTSAGSIQNPSIVNGTSTSGWTRYKLEGTSPAGSKFARIELVRSGFANPGADYLIDAFKWEDKYIVQEDSTAVTFTNSWTDHGSFRACAYYKNTCGEVRIRGVIKNGTIGLSAFTLPSGYRPSATASFIVWSAGAAALVQISSAGAVVPVSGTNTDVHLDGIAFRPD